MLALIWWMYAGYAWLTNSISTRGAAPAGDPARRAWPATSCWPWPSRTPSTAAAWPSAWATSSSSPSMRRSSSGRPRRSPRAPSSASRPYNLFNATLVRRRRRAGRHRAGGAVDGRRRPRVGDAVGGQPREPEQLRDRPRPLRRAPRAGGHRRHRRVGRGRRDRRRGAGGGRRARSSPSCSGCCSARACGGPTSAPTTTSRPSARWPTRPPARQPWIALEGFGVAHYFLLLGIVLAAAGIKKAIGHAYDPLETREALVLGGGVALFLAADVRSPSGSAAAPLAGAARALAAHRAAQLARRAAARAGADAVAAWRHV